MSWTFDFSRLDELIGKRVELIQHPQYQGQIGVVSEVSTTIPVRLRRSLFEEGRDPKALKSEYGHRVHFQVALPKASVTVSVEWQDLEFL